MGTIVPLPQRLYGLGKALEIAIFLVVSNSGGREVPAAIFSCTNENDLKR